MHSGVQKTSMYSNVWTGKKGVGSWRVRLGSDRGLKMVMVKERLWVCRVRDR